MFQDASKKHLLWECKVGGLKANGEQAFGGRGCVLDNEHVLTAAHVWNNIKANFASPLVRRAEGTFACEVVFESAQDDILLLKHSRLIAKSSDNAFSEYPILHREQIVLGRSVALIAQLEVHNGSRDKTKNLTYFGTGHTSLFLAKDANKNIRFGLEGLLTQEGFSGSAVFVPDGSIVGVLSQALTTAVVRDTPLPEHITFPVLAPLFPILGKLTEFLNKMGVDSSIRE